MQREIIDNEQEDEFKDTRESLDRDSTSQIDSSSNRDSCERDNLNLNTNSISNIVMNGINTDNSIKSEEDVSNYEDIDEYESLLQSQISENDIDLKKKTYQGNLESVSKNQLKENDYDEDDDNNYEDYEDNEEELQDKNENNETIKITKKSALFSNEHSNDQALVSFKKGQFYEHDCRIDECEKNSDLKLDRDNILEKHEKFKEDKKLSPERWGHDKFLVNNNNLSRENRNRQKLNQPNKYPKNQYNKYFKNNFRFKTENEHKISANDPNFIAPNSSLVMLPQKEKNNKSFKTNYEYIESKQEIKNAKGLSLSEYMQQNEKHGKAKKNDNKYLNEAKPNRQQINNNILNQINDYENNRSTDLKSRLDFTTRVPTILDNSILDANGNLIYNKISNYCNQSFTKKNSSSISDSNYNSCKNYDLKITTDFNSSRLVSINNKNYRNQNNSYNHSYKTVDQSENDLKFNINLSDYKPIRNKSFKDYVNDNVFSNHNDKYETKDLRAKSHNSKNLNKHNDLNNNNNKEKKSSR